jgi:hypothetical protein
LHVGALGRHYVKLALPLRKAATLLRMGVVLGFANSWTNWNGTLFRKGREAVT